MRVLVMVEPRTTPPMEMMPVLVEAFAQWRERWRSKMEAFEFLTQGGGWGVFNSDESELSQAIMEFPMGPFSAIQVHPTVDGDDALARLTEVVGQRVAQMGG